MSKADIIRAWKDSTYRASLTEGQLAQLPQHPAGTAQVRSYELAHADDEYALYTSFTGSCCRACTASPTGYV